MIDLLENRIFIRRNIDCALHELGGTTTSIILITHNDNLTLFQNFPYFYQSYIYWSGTEWPQVPGGAWVFIFGNGLQDAHDKANDRHFALAVRTGDVAAVPVPAAAWLLSSGLVGLIGVARRRKTA